MDIRKIDDAAMRRDDLLHMLLDYVERRPCWIVGRQSARQERSQVCLRLDIEDCRVIADALDRMRRPFWIRWLVPLRQPEYGLCHLCGNNAVGEDGVCGACTCKPLPDHLRGNGFKAGGSVDGKQAHPNRE